MIAFQLDQCLDSKRFARDCAVEALCQTLRLPSSLRDAKDPVLVSALLSGSNPLVTFDRALPRDHTAAIPAHHPGIVIVSNYPAPQTMTVRIAQNVLKQFKTAFAMWHQVSLRNSVAEITSVGIEVWHVEQAKLVRDKYLTFDADGWQTRLVEVLQLNSQRQ